MEDLIAPYMRALKPEWMNSLDICVLAYLLARADVDGRSRPKTKEIAAACGVRQILSARQSIQRLEQHGLVITTYLPGIGKPKEYRVLADALPSRKIVVDDMEGE